MQQRVMQMPINKQKQSQWGFTLIELMLVILVISLLTVYVVKVINQNLINSQVNRAAVQIQSIKQALIAYYVGVGDQWPADSNQNPDLAPLLNPVTFSGQTLSPFLQSYALCSPFSQSTSSGSCGYSIPYTASSVTNTNYFTFQIVLPSQDLATRLAAVVNNSWITSNTTLNIAVPKPAIIGQLKNHGWIVSAGLISTLPNSGLNPYFSGDKWVLRTGYGALVELPGCPSGFEGHVFFAAQNYETYMDADSDSSNITGYFRMHVTTVDPTTYYNNTDNGNMIFPMTGTYYSYADRYRRIAQGVMSSDQPYEVDMNFSAKSTPDPTVNHMVYFMTYCIASGHWDTFWIDSSFTQDGQCGYPSHYSSWSDYRTGTSHGSGTCRNSFDSDDYPGSSPTRIGAAEAY